MSHHWFKSAAFGLLAGGAAFGATDATAQTRGVAADVFARLIEFDLSAPSVILSATPIATSASVAANAPGLRSGEGVRGLDIRPLDGRLYAVTNQARVLIISRIDGSVTSVGGFPPSDLDGSVFDADFNPVVDQIRLLSDGDINLRINPTTGNKIANETNLAYDPTDANAAINPSVSGAAYTNSTPGLPAPASTRLFAVENTQNTLVVIGSTGGTIAAPGSPNGGRLFTVGTLHIGSIVGPVLDITSESDFDIDQFGTAYLAAQPNGGLNSLYRVNLTTAVATFIGQIGNNPQGTDINDFTIVNGLSDAPLPVELSSFSGSARNGAVQLSWATATELDNAGFAVLRGGVEIATFRATPALVGGGTTSQGRAYGYTDARVQPGQSYTYTLRSYDVSGTTHDYKLTATVEVTGAAALPAQFRLHEAAPNPFNPTTSLQLDLPQSAVVTAVAYNALGQAVRTLVNGQTMSAGTQTVGFAADGLPSGVYMVRVTAVSNGQTAVQSQRVSLAK